MSTVHTPPLVLVEWEDAAALDVGPWVETKADSSYTHKLFLSAGFMLYDGKEGIILTPVWSPDIMAPRDQIPRGMIRKVTRLRS